MQALENTGRRSWVNTYPLRLVADVPFSARPGDCLLLPVFKPSDQLRPFLLNTVALMLFPFAPFNGSFADAKITEVYVFVVIYAQFDPIVSKVHRNLEVLHANFHLFLLV